MSIKEILNLKLIKKAERCEKECYPTNIKGNTKFHILLNPNLVIFELYKLLLHYKPNIEDLINFPLK